MTFMSVLLLSCLGKFPILTLSFSHTAVESHGQNRCPVSQPAGSVQKQQQEAGGCQVLQLPGSEEAAGGGAGPGRALQRHRSYAWTSLSHHLRSKTNFVGALCNTSCLTSQLLLLFKCICYLLVL